MNNKGARSLAYLRGETDVFAEREKIALARQKLKRTGLSYWLCCPNERRFRLFWGMVSLLGNDSRMALSEISRRLDVPLSTVFEMLKEVEKVFTFTVVLKEHEKQALAQISEINDTSTVSYFEDTSEN